MNGVKSAHVQSQTGQEPAHLFLGRNAPGLTGKTGFSHNPLVAGRLDSTSLHKPGQPTSNNVGDDSDTRNSAGSSHFETKVKKLLNNQVYTIASTLGVILDSYRQTKPGESEVISVPMGKPIFPSSLSRKLK